MCNVVSPAFKRDIVLVNRPDASGGQIVGQFWRKGSELCVISEVSDEYVLSGITMIDVRTIQSVKRRFPGKEIYERVLQGVSLSKEAALARRYGIDSKQDVLNEAARRGRLVGVYLEKDSPDIFHVGFVEGVEDKNVVIRPITSIGRLLADRDHHRLQKITRIEIATTYLCALEKYRSYAGKSKR